MGSPRRLKAPKPAKKSASCASTSPDTAWMKAWRKFPGRSFFDKFEEANLAFIYQEETADGELSRFCKFVDRDSMELE